MDNFLLNNESLKKFVAKLKLNKEDKEFLFLKIPELDLEDRISLFKALTEIYFVDLEEAKAKQRLKKLWPAENV